MCLATSPKNGKVSNRNVVMKHYDEDGFVFITVGGSRKSQEMNENPWVATTFMWDYRKDGIEYAKQVRIEGKVSKISRERCQKFFDEELFYCKVRAHLCNQDQPVDWNILKGQHDQLVEDITKGKKALTMPDHYVGYQIVPEKIDFYSAWENHIADRVVFTKGESGWNFIHVAA